MTIRIRNTATGEIKEVEENELQQYGISAPQQTQSFTGKLGSGALGLLKNIGLLATGLPRSVLTAGSEIAQMPTKLVIEQRLKKLQSQPQTQESVDEQVRLAKELEHIAKTPLLTGEEQQIFSKGMGAGALKGAKMGAGTGGALLPGFGALQGMLAGGVTGFAASGESLEETVGGTLLGTALGGITGEVTKLGSKLFNKITGRKPKAIKVTGKELPSDPFFSTGKKELQKMSDDIGLVKTLSPDDQATTIGKAFNNMQDDIQKLLKGADPVDENKLLDTFADELLGTEFRDATPTQRAFINQLLSRVEKTKFDPVKINALKSSLRGELGSAFTAIKAGRVPKSTDQAKMALYKSLKISLDDVSPRIRSINTKQNTLYNLADEVIGGIQNSPNAKITPPLVKGVGLELPFTQADVTSKVATAMGLPSKLMSTLGQSTGGRAVQQLSRVAPALAGMGVSTIAGAETPAIQEVQQQTGEQMLQGMLGVGAEPQVSQQQSELQQNLLMLMLLDPSNAKTYEMIAKMQGGEGVGADLTADQRKGITKLDQAANLVDEYETQLKKIGSQDIGPLARVLGVGKGIAAAAGAAPNVKAFKEFRKGTRATLAKALGEVGTLSDTDKKDILALIPNVTDSTIEIELKLQQMRTLINRNKESILTGGL